LNVSAEKRNRRTGSGSIRRRHCHVRRSLLAARRLIALARLHFLAEHRAPLLFHREAIRAEKAAHHGGEDEGAGAAGLRGDVRQLGHTLQGLAHPDGPVEAEALTREHAARQGHGWDHAGVAGAPVGTQRVRAEARQEVKDVPARRERIAHRQLALGAGEGQAQEISRRRGDDVGGLLAPADVSLQAVRSSSVFAMPGTLAWCGGSRRWSSWPRSHSW
jgi:hypothetical protein